VSKASGRELDGLTVARLTGAAWRHASGWEPARAGTAAAVTYGVGHLLRVSTT